MRQGGLILAAGRVRSKKQNIRKPPLSLIHISEPTRQEAISYAVFCLKKKNTEKSAPPKTHHEIRSSPVIASNSRRHARKHVPRVSPYSPASIDPGFVEIGLVQLSQSVKTTNVTHT